MSLSSSLVFSPLSCLLSPLSSVSSLLCLLSSSLLLLFFSSSLLSSVFSLLSSVFFSSVLSSSLCLPWGGLCGVCGSDDSKHAVSVQGHADYAPNWVAEHLVASSRRPRHPFPALMAGEPLAVYLCTRPKKKPSRHTMSCNCGDLRSFLQVWTLALSSQQQNSHHCPRTAPVCVVCDTLKNTVCRFNTSSCVRSTRLRVYRQQAHAGIHGDVLNVHTTTS